MEEKTLNIDEIANEKPFDLAKHSSIGVGGKADVAFYPRNVEQLMTLLQCLQTGGREYYVVGNMTNVLPADAGTHKAIICLKALTGMQAKEKLFAFAGEQSGNFLRACRNARKSGGEFLAGIPCTIGGALYMNAGANGEYIAEIVDSVLVIREGQLRKISCAECGYSYKNSVFMTNKDVIVGATFCLADSDENKIDERLQSFQRRRAHLPTGRSMGCVFKNPDGCAAGELIERAGLKGLRVGGAKISEKHANFIINEHGATQRDISALISLIKNAVCAQYGVTLSEEIRYIT